MSYNSFTSIDLTRPRALGYTIGCGFNWRVLNEQEEPLSSVVVKIGASTRIELPGYPIDCNATFMKKVVPIQVIDVSNGNSEIPLGDLLEYEDNYGRLKKHSLVVFYTGWNGRGEFYSLSENAAELLVSRNVVGIALDTPNPDPPGSFTVHKLMLGSGKVIFENLCNLHMLPPTGAFLCVVLPEMRSVRESVVGIIPV